MCALTSAAALELQNETAALALSAEVVDQKVVQKAIRRAADFVRKVSPSGLPTEEISTEETWRTVERTPALASPATRYGVWWHEFVQKVPWKEDAASWDVIFEAANSNSPDMARSAREWKLLRETVSSISAFGLGNGSTVVRPEMPFFWRMDEGTCLEGIVDLALFEPSTNRWLILDWKTNKILPEKAGRLREEYKSQMAAYWRAVTEMTGMAADAGLFSTHTGIFVKLAPEELEREWARLAKLPPKRLVAEISAPRF